MDFFHGTSHFVGLEVHDAGLHHKPLTVGTVITVEPGIYLEDENLGIRIEDEVLVTETGHEVLTREIPKTVDEIEAVMKRSARGCAPLSSASQRARPAIEGAGAASPGDGGPIMDNPGPTCWLEYSLLIKHIIILK